MTGTFYNEGMKYNFLLESGEDIVTHTTHMVRLDHLDIASIQTNPHNFQEKCNIYQRSMPSAWSAQPNSQYFNINF